MFRSDGIDANSTHSNMFSIRFVLFTPPVENYDNVPQDCANSAVVAISNK